MPETNYAVIIHQFQMVRTLGEPFYLKIWFSEPHFIQSQVVAATGKRIEYYEKLFVPNVVRLKIPFEKYAHESYDLTAFDWELRVDEEPYFKYADEFTDEEFERLKKKAFRVEQLDEGEMMLTVKKGNIFVGERTSNKLLDTSAKQRLS